MVHKSSYVVSSKSSPRIQPQSSTCMQINPTPKSATQLPMRWPLIKFIAKNNDEPFRFLVLVSKTSVCCFVIPFNKFMLHTWLRLPGENNVFCHGLNNLLLRAYVDHKFDWCKYHVVYESLIANLVCTRCLNCAYKIPPDAYDKWATKIHAPKRLQHSERSSLSTVSWYSAALVMVLSASPDKYRLLKTP